MARTAPIDDVPAGDGVIRLGQFLQLAGLVDSGGEAKEAIRQGEVLVNDEVDLRRGRQLQVGDVVAFAGRRARVAD
ncbi:RNA-binding S4 domain-containing protein [Demequina sp.]|uniref:RNA-binding S4 domain-containing protein n=1 Tax=Demequina sp. TaxID=2050685 RepID=UPI003A8A74E0